MAGNGDAPRTAGRFDARAEAAYNASQKQTFLPAFPFNLFNRQLYPLPFQL